MIQAKMIAVPCLPFELSPMNKFVLDIIYTWLSVCNAYHLTSFDGYF